MRFKIMMDIPTKTFQAKKLGKNRRTGKTIMYKDDDVQAIEEEYEYLMKTHKPPEPLDGALKLTLYFVFKTKDKRKWGQYKATQPDWDNISKIPCDCMQRLGFYTNDSRVADGRAIKAWGKEGSLEVELFKLM